MRSRKLYAILEDLHHQDTDVRSQPRAELEQQLFRRHRELYSRQSAAHHARSWALLRPLFAVVIVLAVGLGVSVIPASYPLILGRLVMVDMSAGEGGLPAPTELLVALEAWEAADQISVSIDDGRERRVSLVLMGHERPTDELRAFLRRAFPVFAGARFTSSGLHGSVQTSMARTMGHALFGINASGREIEMARRQVLLELSREGYRNSDVFMEEKDGHKRIEVEMEPQD